MPAKRFKESDIDFEAIENGMANLAPPKLALEEVLARLRPKMLLHRERGVSVGQLCELLGENGVEVGERSLRSFLDRGRLPGRRAARALAAATREAGTEGAGTPAPVPDEGTPAAA